MRNLLIISLLLYGNTLFAQELEPEPAAGEQQEIENQAETDDNETEDDSYLQNLEHYRKHPLNINEADAGELKEFKMLNPLQIQNFIFYRNLLGLFVSIYELQAIPLWDIVTIKKLLPFIKVGEAKTISQKLKESISMGDNSLMIRFSKALQKSKGFSNTDSSSAGYLGSHYRLLFRYKFNFKNQLQYGILGDKDAGEQFFKGAQKHGFDFYSFHLFARKIGIIKSLALGDFTVNFGQGLIQWQSLAFKKTTALASAKRHGDAIRPYNSTGEYNFYRGAGITLKKKNWETTAFASIRKMSANITLDSLHDQKSYITSVLNSGYHRTAAELEDRNSVQFLSFGANINYSIAKGHAGLNTIQYNFSRPFHPSDKPYDIFSIDGKQWNNYSFDYSYTFRNIHIYGEIASDRKLETAFIQGMIASIDPSVDLVMIYRKINKRYQSLSGNAFTENVYPVNETGFYTGISIMPAYGWKIDAYADCFKFPWLKFTTDAPGYGYDYLLQCTFSPNKQSEISGRFKMGAKQVNSDAGHPVNQLVYVPRQNLRLNFSSQINPQVLLRSRVEVLWYDKTSESAENGYLAYVDVSYKPGFWPIAGNTRIQYFETDGYNSRLYSYEKDVLFSYSSPAIFEKGFRWYLNLKTNVSKGLFPTKHKMKLEIWARYSLTYYPDLDKIGSGQDEIKGKKRSELKFQLLFSR